MSCPACEFSSGIMQLELLYYLNENNKSTETFRCWECSRFWRRTEKHGESIRLIPDDYCNKMYNGKNEEQQ